MVYLMLIIIAILVSYWLNKDNQDRTPHHDSRANSFYSISNRK